MQNCAHNIESLQGIRPADHIGICGGNHICWIVAELGVLLSSLVCVPLDPLVRFEELVLIAQSTKLSAIICSADCYSLVHSLQSVCPFIKHIVTWNNDCILLNPTFSESCAADFCSLQIQHCSKQNCSPPVPKPVYAIIFTSGTSGTTILFFSITY